MRKAKGRRSEAQNPKPVEESVKEETGGFFACYLLCSLSPSHKGHTYIGFTINPRRRIRQHNGEIRCGAWRTKKKRPWEMILCIYGFPSNVSALQFEWAWQHPRESLAVRKAAASLESLSRKSLSRITKNIKLAYTMLTLPAWQNLKLTVNFFSTKYMKYAAGCPTLPEQMHVQVCPMDELPCYVDNLILENDDDVDEDENLNVDNGHEKNAMDMSANHTWADQHNIEKVATSDLFPLIEEHDFVHSPSTPKVNTLSSVNFRSSSGKNIWEWNGEGNVGQSMQQMSMPGADRNPLSSISILSPEVYVGNTQYNMEKVATGNLFPSIDEQAFEISPSTPRTDSRQSSVDFRYSSKDIQECNGEGNPRQSMEQKFTPKADNNPLSSISILSPEVSVGGSIQILDNYPVSCLVSPGSIFKEDMQTPPPLRCRIRSFSKSAPTYPEIIDLTDSPNFIQL